MNSFKSVCSFAKTTPVPLYELEQDVEPFVGCQTGVVIVVSLVGIFETAERLNDSVHVEDFTTPAETSTARHSLLHRAIRPDNDIRRTAALGRGRIGSHDAEI